MATRLGDIDPKNLKFDFEREWNVFHDSKIQRFLVVWLEGRLHARRCALETVPPERLGEAQGAAQELKSLLSVLKRPFANDAVKEAIEFLEKNYGN